MRAGRRLAANAERYLKPPAQMARLFADRPDAVHATRELADRLQFTMQDLGYRFPKYPIPDGETEISFLRKIAEVGARNRYRPFHDRARAQVARELDLIEKLELAGYFLIVWDIVNFCRQQDILVQGRGSAANSAVCYSLGITAVDPVGMELLFERFLSEERGEWPDIDLDLPSGDRREAVIQHVYKKYGQHGAAMTANVITYRGKSAAREVGKALDLDEGQIDRLAKVMHQFEYIDPDETLAEQARRGRHGRPRAARAPLRRAVAADAGPAAPPRPAFRRHGGVPGRSVVGRAARKRQHARPRRRAVGQGRLRRHGHHQGRSARPRDDGGAAGHAYADQSARDQGSGIRDQEVTLASLPPDDPEVYAMLRAADTIGVFQVESRAQMATLPRLRPENFYDLVVEVALIRPGPIVGQMVHPYLNRRAGREAVTYDHPLLEPILKRTLGVPLFQEQLLRMAMAVAGFTGGQAEDLRRAMGFKRSEKRMKQLEGLLREGMAKHGITGDTADRIVLSITSFALYGFPESHAASFALIAYASAYFKMHYPAAFYTALLNNQPMGFYHPATLVKDAQRRGVRFNPIDVQVSDWDCTVEGDGAVRLGLAIRARPARGDAGQKIATMQATPEAVASEPHAERCPKCGCDDPVDDRGSYPKPASPQARKPCFCNVCSHEWSVHRSEVRVSVSARSMIWFAASRCAATRSRCSPRSARSIRSATIAARRCGRSSARSVQPAKCFETFRRTYPSTTGLARRKSPLDEMNISERLIADYTGTGLTVGPHPLTFRRRELAMRGVIPALDLPRQRAGRRVRTAGMVITRQRPGTAKGFVFLTLEDETGISNIIIRPDLYATDRLTVVESSFLLVEGILQNQDGVTSIKAERMSKLDGMPDEAAIDSHDFH